VVFDADWVEESVRDPDARAREGDWRRMPAFDGRQLDADSLATIVAYLEAVGPAAPDTTP
jgi:mono/diheme cytochrome c family protein